jgi:4-amino-4-deoxychorismate lyase
MPTAKLLETIKIEDGKIHNLIYHQARCNYSRRVLFESNNTLNLEAFIKAPKEGLYRCRVIYAENIQSIEYLPYKVKKIQILKIVSSHINYEHKYANRDEINQLVASNPDADDILIEKEGYIADTSIANIAFYDGTSWFTPAQPLLKGTMRQQLIDNGFLQTRDIKAEDISTYAKVALMNSMIGFNIIKDIKIS